MGNRPKASNLITIAQLLIREVADPEKSVSARVHLLMAAIDCIGTDNRLPFNEAGGSQIIEEMACPLLGGFNYNQLIDLLGFLDPEASIFMQALESLWQQASSNKSREWLFLKAVDANSGEGNEGRHNAIRKFWHKKIGWQLQEGRT